MIFAGNHKGRDIWVWSLFKGLQRPFVTKGKSEVLLGSVTDKQMWIPLDLNRLLLPCWKLLPLARECRGKAVQAQRREELFPTHSWKANTCVGNTGCTFNCFQRFIFGLMIWWQGYYGNELHSLTMLHKIIIGWFESKAFEGTVSS